MTVRLVLTAGLLVVGLLGCLRSFAPDLRPRGTHAGVPPSSPNATCMDCHESEADALARMHANAPSGSATHTRMPDSGAPLVADWMITTPQPCTHCHRIRGDE